MSNDVHVPTPVTLAEVLSAARQARLEGHTSHPHQVWATVRRTSPARELHELYDALLAHVADPEEQRVLRCYVDTLTRGHVFFTGGGEHRLIEQVWKRLVSDQVPPITADEQRAWNLSQLRELHRREICRTPR